MTRGAGWRPEKLNISKQEIGGRVRQTDRQIYMNPLIIPIIHYCFYFTFIHITANKNTVYIWHWNFLHFKNMNTSVKYSIKVDLILIWSNVTFGFGWEIFFLFMLSFGLSEIVRLWLITCFAFLLVCFVLLFNLFIN